MVSITYWVLILHSFSATHLDSTSVVFFYVWLSSQCGGGVDRMKWPWKVPSTLCKILPSSGQILDCCTHPLHRLLRRQAKKLLRLVVFVSSSTSLWFAESFTPDFRIQWRVNVGSGPPPSPNGFSRTVHSNGQLNIIQDVIQGESFACSPHCVHLTKTLHLPS